MAPGRDVLLIGAGLMGGRAASDLVAAGHRVTVLTRGERPLPHGVARLVADRRNPASLAHVLDGTRFDLTVDFLAYDAGDVERLMLVARAALGHIVMISTGQVYLVTTATHRPYREADSDAPIIPKPAAWAPDHVEWTYGVGKRQAEAALQTLGRANGLRTTALRLPIVLGEGDATLRLWSYLERLLDGGPILLPQDAVTHLRFIHAGDVSRAILRIVEGPAPSEFAYNLAQPDAVTLKELVERIAGAARAKPKLIEVARADLDAARIGRTYSPYGTPWVSYLDPGRAALEWGFKATPLDGYLPAVVQWHLAHRPERSHPGYAFRAAERALATRVAAV